MRRDRWASAFEAGRVFGAWVLAAHRASQEQDFSARLALQRSFVLTPAELRGFGAVPPGLPERAGRDASFTVGIMDDGRGQAGLPPVAMAFGVLEPARTEAAPALRSGAIAAGLAALAEAGSTDTVMADHVPAIEGALGQPLAADTFYVTADAGLRYADAVLYRRPQPGRPGLNRMATALDGDGHDVTGIWDAKGSRPRSRATPKPQAAAACPAMRARLAWRPDRLRRALSRQRRLRYRPTSWSGALRRDRCRRARPMWPAVSKRLLRPPPAPLPPRPWPRPARSLSPAHRRRRRSRGRC